MRAPANTAAVLVTAVTAALISTPAAHAATIYIGPGDRITNGEGRTCTVTFTDPARNRAYTARHCYRSNRAITDGNGNTIGAFNPTIKIDEVPDRAVDVIHMNSLIAIDLNRTVEATDTIIGTGERIVDILRVPIKNGTPVCKFGQVTGRTCGTISAVGPETLTVDIESISGDSGSPLYAATSNGKAVLVGLIVAAKPSGTTAYAYPSDQIASYLNSSDPGWIFNNAA